MWSVYLTPLQPYSHLAVVPPLHRCGICHWWLVVHWPRKSVQRRESDRHAAPAPALPLETGVMQLHRLEFYYEESM